MTPGIPSNGRRINSSDGLNECIEMTVQHLIGALAVLPAAASVWCVWDGEARDPVERLWLSRDGRVCLSAEGEPVYHDEDRPLDAPSETLDPYWEAP